MSLNALSIIDNNENKIWTNDIINPDLISAAAIKDEGLVESYEACVEATSSTMESTS